MARIRTITLGLVKNPPLFGLTIASVGNTPARQVYDALTGTYSPDYTLVPLTLRPEVAAVDPDRPLGSTNGRTLLTNIHWYEVSATGKRTEITVSNGSSTPAGYSRLVNTEGNAEAGTLQMVKNSDPKNPVRLIFSATLVDGTDRYDIEQSCTVLCKDTTAQVTAKFDLPAILPYNPIHDTGTVTARLTVREGGKVADTSHYIPVWEVRRDDGSWTEYGTETTDFWMTVAPDKHSAAIDRTLMGDGRGIRVRLRYSVDGKPSSVTLKAGDLGVPFCQTEMVRDLGEWWDRLVGVTNQLSSGTESVRPKVAFKDGMGDIAYPENHFFVTFYGLQPGKSPTSSDIVGQGLPTSSHDGLETEIPASRGNAQGLKIGYSAEEVGPYKAWADSDGAIIADSDGAIILIR